MNIETIETLLSRTTPEPNTGCMLWTQAVNADGYGIVMMGGRSSLAHRAMHALAIRESPEAVMHVCDQPCCLNPKHLKSGTRRLNNEDRDRKGRTPKGADRPNAKLTDSAVAEMRSRRRNGAKLRDLAADYDVPQQIVSLVCLGRRWKHVPS